MKDIIQKIKTKISSFKGIANYLPKESVENEINDFVQNVSGRHNTPQNDWVPSDLKDTKGDWVLTKNGYLVASQILPHEVHVGSSSPATVMFLGLFPLVYVISMIATTLGIGMVGTLALAIYFGISYSMFGFFRTLGIFMLGMPSLILGPTVAPMLYTLSGGAINLTYVAMILSVAPALTPIIYQWYVSRKRVKELVYQARIYKNGTKGTSFSVNKARQIQAVNAYKDKSTFIDLGFATGSMASIGDVYGPDNGKRMGLTVNDASNHVFVFGSTRSGKTSSIIKPIVKVLVNEDVGLFVGDGKGALAKECDQMVKVISPETVDNYNVFTSLPNHQFASVIRNMFAPKGRSKGNPFFDNWAETILNFGKVFHEELVKAHKSRNSLTGIINVISQMAVAESDINDHSIVKDLEGNPDLFTPGTLLNNAVNVMVEVQGLANETRSSIFGSVNGMLYPFIQNQDLLKWADSETNDIDLNSLLKGAKFGLCLPEKQYGLAGACIQVLTKTLINTAIYNRGEGWKSMECQKRVFCVIDECHILLTEEDQTMLTVGAGLGISFIEATQTLENLKDVLGDDKAFGFLDCFRSVATFKSSQATYKYVADRVGEGNLKVTNSTKFLDLEQTAINELSSPYFDANHHDRSDIIKIGLGESMFNRIEKKKLSDKSDFAPSYTDFSYHEQPKPYFNDKSVQKLNTPFSCFASFHRGDVPRRDVMYTQPLDGNFKPFKVGEVEIEKLTDSEATKELARIDLEVAEANRNIEARMQNIIATQ
jgi:type IV secretory pathway TraG/TraD family ATPase VirD4